jgi:hypothetical protein
MELPTSQATDLWPRAIAYRQISDPKDSASIEGGTCGSTKAYGHGAPGGNHSSSRMLEPQTYAKTDGDGQNENEVRSKRLILPIEDVNVRQVLVRMCVRRNSGWILRRGRRRHMQY